MTGKEIALRRLRSQRLSKAPFEKAEEVVAWLGAVQAQDFAAAKWAVGLRAEGLTDVAIDQAFAEGRILRTHLLRPTWHFVTPADIRWLLALTSPRVHAANAPYCRQFALDNALLARCCTVLTNALQGGRQLTRAELAQALTQAGIDNDEQRMVHIMMHAELEGIVCSGSRRGKQFTYALLEERAPTTAPLNRDEALAELARRYFIRRGPATLQDFVWWSGLTVADARRGLESVQGPLVSEVADGQTYWFPASAPPAAEEAPRAFLLPNYDEYTVGYADRSAVWDAAHDAKLGPRNNVLFNHTIVIDGQIRGLWKRTLKAKAVVIELTPFAPLTEGESQAVTQAAQRYGDFLGLRVVLKGDEMPTQYVGVPGMNSGATK